MTDKIIRIGTVGFPIQKKLFVDDVDVVELTESRYVPPGRKAARQQRGELPARLECIVQMSRYFVITPPDNVALRGHAAAYGRFQVTDETRSLWNRQIDYAQEMGARLLMLLTPADITPAGPSVTAMSTFLQQMDRRGLQIAWEPRGPWSDSQIRQFASAHELIRAVDPLRDPVPAGPLALFRMGPFSASGSRMSVHAQEQILEAAQNCDASIVYCVLDTARAVDDARNLRQLLHEEAQPGFDY